MSRWYYSGALVLLILLLSFTREPLFFTHPRLWAEEGGLFIRAVFDHGVTGSLLQPHAGYLSLFPNYIVAGGMAMVGLEHIAYVTTFASFLVIVVTILTPLFLSSSFWNTDQKRVLLVVFSLLIGDGEIWVNTITSQFYFALFSCYLLLGDLQSVKGWRAGVVLLMVAHGAFTGVTSVVLTPFFLWRALRERQSAGTLAGVTALLCVGTLVQGGVILFLATQTEIARFSLEHLHNLPRALFRNLTSVVPVVNGALRALCASLILVIVIPEWRRIKRQPQPVVLALYLSVVFALFSVKMLAGGRYGYIPAVLLFLTLLQLPPLATKLRHWALVAIIASLLLLSTVKFFDTALFYDPQWERYSLTNAYPNAAGELEIKIFPQWSDNSWVLTLPPNRWEAYR